MASYAGRDANDNGTPLDFGVVDHYKILGVPRNASEAEIRSAYRSLARQHHPDKNNGSPEAKVRFLRIQQAHDTLVDPVKRKEYDLNGGPRSYVSYEEADRMTGQGRRSQPHDNGAADPAARRKGIALLALVLLVLLALPRELLFLLPGIGAGVAVVALLLRRRGELPVPKWAWCALAFLLFGYVVPWFWRATYGAPLSAQPFEGGAELLQGPWRGAGMEAPMMGPPRSGEEVLLGDGSFARVSDPAGAPEDDVAPGWQQRLWAQVTAAVGDGKEQVVLVFSREGCPWCERQVPVLRRAIQARSRRGEDAPGVPAPAAPAAAAAAAAASPPAAVSPAADAPGDSAAAPAAQPPPSALGAPAFLAARGSSRATTGAAILAAPLRAFVLDAGELPQLADAFQVEAFPTIIAFSVPGTTPLAAQGYLDDSAFEQLLRAAAESADGAAAQRRGGMLR